jgi:hypothetical protein
MCWYPDPQVVMKSRRHVTSMCCEMLYEHMGQRDWSMLVPQIIESDCETCLFGIKGYPSLLGISDRNFSGHELWQD